LEILLVSPEISLTSVVKCCGVVVVNQRGVKKHELRLKVRSMPITIPDAIVDLSMAEKVFDDRRAVESLIRK
jgi:hypothetical protein